MDKGGIETPDNQSFRFDSDEEFDIWYDVNGPGWVIVIHPDGSTEVVLDATE